MKKVYYEKVGRRYKPVAEFDSDYSSSFPQGTHLVICNPNGVSRRFNVEPAFAPMIAAGRFATDVISTAIMNASDLRPSRSVVTEEQDRAWRALSAALGDSKHALTWPSAYDTAEAAVTAMSAEAEKLLQHPMAREAYNEFMAICKLVNEPT